MSSVCFILWNGMCIVKMHQYFEKNIILHHTWNIRVCQVIWYPEKILSVPSNSKVRGCMDPQKQKLVGMLLNYSKKVGDSIYCFYLLSCTHKVNKYLFIYNTIDARFEVNIIEPLLWYIKKIGWSIEFAHKDRDWNKMLFQFGIIFDITK